jgi:hypothetical protein
MKRAAASFRFLASQLTAGHHAAPPDRPLAELPWEDIVALANWQQVTPALWCGLRAQGVAHLLPGEAQEFLCYLHAQNVKRNGHLHRQIIEETWALNRAGIEPLLLKGGAYLLLDLFGDPGARILCDIDMLVPAEQLDLAWQTLHELGYKANPEEAKRFTDHHHLPPLYRAGDHASIEIHQRPLHDRADAFLGAAQLWQESIALDIEGARLRVSDPTSLVLHNILHTQVVNLFHQRGLVCLRHLHDLAHLQHRFGTQVDWARIDALFARHKRSRVLHTYLHLAQQLVNVRPPLGIEPGLSSALHYWRCLARLQWPGVAHLDNGLQNFRAANILKRYHLPDTPTALGVGRLRYAGHLLRRSFRRTPEDTGQALPSGHESNCHGSSS